MKSLRIGLLLFALLPALIVRAGQIQVPQYTPAGQDKLTHAEPKEYVRFVEDDKGAQLQTGVTTFRNADGVTVDLVGAIHVADHAYYVQLNDRFLRYDAVLYEMVGGPIERRMKRHKLTQPEPQPPATKPDPAALKERVHAIESYITNHPPNASPKGPPPKLPSLPGAPSPTVDGTKSGNPSAITPPSNLAPDEPSDESEAAGADRLSWLTGLFSQLQSSLALESQLTAIDYLRPNFVHADMTLTQFFKLQDERNEGFFMLWLKAVKAQIVHPETSPPNQPGILKILEILCRKDSATELKRLVGRTFDGVEMLMTGIESENGTVIIAERNKVALGVLQKQIADGKKKLAIFYGSAHLPDMQKRLMAMGFTRAGHEWLTAWSLPPEPKSETLAAPDKPEDKAPSKDPKP